jgi:hypothetical protein
MAEGHETSPATASAHTQGTWYAVFHEKEGCWCVHARHVRGTFEFDHELTQLNFGGKEAEANARLIAAAPDLLEALDSLLEQTLDLDLASGNELMDREKEAYEKAIAAIAKARGGQCDASPQQA